MDITVTVDKGSGKLVSVSVDGVLVPAKHCKLEEVVRSKELPPTVILDFAAKSFDENALAECSVPRCLAVVPWAGARVPPGCSFAESTTYVFDASCLPETESYFPFNWRFASGIAMVEIEPVLDDATGVLLGNDFFMTHTFTAKLSELAKAVRGPNSFEEMPGFVLKDTVRHLVPYAGPCAHGDPLLATYKPGFEDTCRLNLQEQDYVAFCR